MRRRHFEVTFSAFVLLCVAFGHCACATADEPASLPNLLKLYREYGLPFPPDDAKLVRVKLDPPVSKGKADPPKYWLAFEWESKEPPGERLWLSSSQVFSAFSEASEIARPDAKSADGCRPSEGDDLMMAILCHARGWDELAAKLLASARVPGASSDLCLGRLAFSYWKSRLLEPKLDRAPAARIMRRLIDQDKELQLDHHRALVRSLELAVVPSKAKPGSVAAMFDALVDYPKEPGRPEFFEPNDPYWRIAQHGFDVVPELIERLSDDRLTRAQMEGINNFRSWPMRVRDLVGDILDGFAGEPLMRGVDGPNPKDVGNDWITRLHGWRVTKTAASKWWQIDRKTGEETYALQRVLPARKPGDDEAEVNPYLLTLLSAKYPNRVPELYRKILVDRPDVESYLVAHALAMAKLPKEKTTESLAAGARHKNPHHQDAALYAILDHDRRQFVESLREALNQIPEDVPGVNASWPHECVLRWVRETNDPRVWDTVAAVARRSKVGVRMQVLKDAVGNGSDKQTKLRLLSQFLGDGAAEAKSKSEVRNFAALQIASLLDMKVETNPKRTDEEWTRLRDQVRAAMARELGNK